MPVPQAFLDPRLRFINLSKELTSKFGRADRRPGLVVGTLNALPGRGTTVFIGVPPSEPAAAIS
jgi:hypothetical protein